MAFGEVVQTNSGTSTLATTTLTSPTTAGNLVLTFVSDDYNGTPDKFRDGAADVPRRLSVVVEVRWLGLDPELHHRGSALRSTWAPGRILRADRLVPYDRRTGIAITLALLIAFNASAAGGDGVGSATGVARQRRWEASALAAFLGGRSACRGSMYSCKLISAARR